MNFSEYLYSRDYKIVVSISVKTFLTYNNFDATIDTACNLNFPKQITLITQALNRN